MNIEHNSVPWKGEFKYKCNRRFLIFMYLLNIYTPKQNIQHNNQNVLHIYVWIKSDEHINFYWC